MEAAWGMKVLGDGSDLKWNGMDGFGVWRLDLTCLLWELLEDCVVVERWEEGMGLRRGCNCVIPGLFKT